MKKLLLGSFLLTCLNFAFGGVYSANVDIYQGGGKVEQTVVLLKGEAAIEMRKHLSEARKELDDYYNPPRRTLRRNHIECFVEIDECYIHILRNGEAMKKAWKE